MIYRLPEEWNGSPVRMLEADKSKLRKDLWQRIMILFFCCKSWLLKFCSSADTNRGLCRTVIIQCL